jgi:hypothetical protein
MENGINTNDLLRLIGVMAVVVGAAWAIQVLLFGGSSAFGRMVWIMSAAMVAGGGTGLIYSSASLGTDSSKA